MTTQGLKAMAGNCDLKLGHFIVEFATPGIDYIVKNAGCDYALFDTEHSGFHHETIKSALRYFEAAQIPTIVRVPSNGYNHVAQNDARFWDRAARKYATDPIADTVGYERTLERTRHYLRGNEMAFEFGCGTGTTALKLAPSLARIVATDISNEMIAIARERAESEGCSNAVFEVATPDAVSWPEDTFDIALGFNVLHLMSAREAALRGIHRLLKPGGLFISKTPCLKEMNPFVRLAVPVMQVFGKAPYVAFLSAQDLESEIKAAGFEIVERARHGSRGRDARPFLVARKR